MSEPVQIMGVPDAVLKRARERGVDWRYIRNLRADYRDMIPRSPREPMTALVWAGRVIAPSASNDADWRLVLPALVVVHDERNPEDLIRSHA